MPPAVIPTREQPERWPVAEKTDLLAPEVLADPHRYYRELLEMGPAVWLPVHGVLAVLSDAEIRTVLKDEERFPGVGATPPGDIGAKLWARTVLSIGQQPVAQSGRSPRPAAVDVGQWMDAHAAEVVDECVGEREFGAVALARRFIAGVVMRLTGARGTAEIEAKPTAAAHKAGWTGPGSSLLGAAAPRATAMTTHLCETVSRENVTEGSWLDTLYREADRGRIGHGAVVRLAAECATTGMDTAIHGICTALDTLATRQDLWADLRRRHIRGVDVVREALRLDPLVPGVARLAARDTHIGGIPVRAKDPVWLSHLAAGIDPAKWGQNAHQFIVPRARNSDYLAFGTDPFSQVGQTLAERAADLLLTHLAFRCTRLEPAGAPERDLSTPARSGPRCPYASLRTEDASAGPARSRPPAARPRQPAGGERAVRRHDPRDQGRAPCPPSPSGGSVTGRPATSHTNTVRDAVLSGGTVQAGEVHGGVHFHHAPVSPVSLPRPSQLPRSPVHFTDRGDHLNALDTACTAPDGAPLVALSGISGIGKSALAVHWLTQRRESYPDGLLYADIHRAGGPRQVLRRWLNALGHRQSPGDLDELAALWRSVTTGLRIAVLVDDVRDPAQVAHLMPAGTNSLTVVTGRRKHWELALQGAFFQDLHPLPSDEAVQLLTRYLGMGEERTSADVAAARRISEACACVPLALALTGARLAAHGDLPLALLLTPTPSPSLEDPAVDAINTALDAAYGRLLPGAQFLYRTLGVLPTASFDTHGTAAAADIPLPDAGQHLTALCNARLLEAQASGRFGPRYAFTAAAQSHAQGLAEATDGARARSQTVRRWCDWVLWTATEAQKLLTPAQATLPRTYAHQPVGPALFHDATGALAWLEDHQDAVLATVSAAADAEWHDTAWQLADALWPLFHYLHLYELWIAVHRIGLRSAILAGNRPAERQMHNSGAIGLSNSGLLEEAIEWYSRSLRAATAAGDARDEGQAHIGLAACHFNARRLEAAEWDVRQAITAWDSCDYRRGVGLAWTLKGEIAVAQGDLSQAVRSFTSAHRELTEVDDPFNAARALAFRGHARALDGDHEVGIRELGQALVTFDDAGAQRWQARGRHLLGQAYAAAGDTGTARAHYADSADRYDRFDPPRAEEVRALLAAL